ncbi:uncharacterized protein LOC123880654 isoform X2 [Maniola jurtina]|uniref:uncharacterized protein LOC123880654 isoform X2 n=1 Tax=Maniola jurtina TaxID=191418 RepID=UPI001E687BB5|nr:uncharacterized protein LOC123880654 isoform X2 [Maniola jurtina]
MEQPYSVKDLKAIVDYLSEHNAYGEVTGKKVWMDLAASSKVKNRTWQSLKKAYFRNIELTKPLGGLRPKQGICSTSKDYSDGEVQIVESEEEIIDRNSADEKEGEREYRRDIFLPLNQEALQENSNLRSNKNENLENGLKRANSQELETNKRILLADSGTSDSSGTCRRSWKTERRKCTISHSSETNYGNGTFESSDWIPEPWSERVSSLPARFGSKGRYIRKYLQHRLWVSLPVLSFREDSGSVEDNNAVVQNGQSPKNNDTYTREDDLDQDVVFWKLLYSKEKEKTEELTKLINQTKGEEQQGEHSRVPPEQPTSAQNSNANESALTPESTQYVPETSQVPPRPQPHPPKEKVTVKMKFIKKNVEVQVQVKAYPSQLGPIMARVAQLFQKEPEQ